MELTMMIVMMTKTMTEMMDASLSFRRFYCELVAFVWGIASSGILTWDHCYFMGWDGIGFDYYITCMWKILFIERFRPKMFYSFHLFVRIWPRKFWKSNNFQHLQCWQCRQFIQFHFILSGVLDVTHLQYRFFFFI